MQNNYAYVTVLTNMKYLIGAQRLAKSLERVNSKFPLVILTNMELQGNLIEQMKNFKNVCIQRFKQEINPTNDIIVLNNSKGMQHWTASFAKLNIFNLTSYHKIIYLDSDMYITRNIDHLFASENMSAVIAGSKYPGNETWRDINSGLLVIKPNHRIFNELLETLNSYTVNDVAVGDQDILNAYFKEWPITDALHLSEGYNIFFQYLDYYINNLNYSLDEIYVIHFIGAAKPWQWSKREYLLYLAKLFIKGDFNKAKILRRYTKLLEVDK